MKTGWQGRLVRWYTKTIRSCILLEYVHLKCHIHATVAIVTVRYRRFFSLYLIISCQVVHLHQVLVEVVVVTVVMMPGISRSSSRVGVSNSSTVSVTQGFVMPWSFQIKDTHFSTEIPQWLDYFNLPLMIVPVRFICIHTCCYVGEH